MNRRKIALLLTAAGLSTTLAIAVQAQEDEVGKIAKKPAFEEIDKNADGAITAKEAEASWLAESFLQVDVDKDGSVSKEEYEKAQT